MIANLKEIRFQVDGGLWRVAFAFDRKRIAIVLAAGDGRGTVLQGADRDGSFQLVALNSHEPGT